MKVPSATLVALRGVIYALAFMLLWTWLALSVRRFDGHIPLTIPNWLQPVGWLLAILGAALSVLCVATFIARGRGTPAPFDPPREFVASGPYQYSRNPMYLGGTGVLLGLGLILQSVAIVVLAAVFVLLAHAFVVLYEERGLARRFGASYQRYRESVPRWIPTVRTPSAGSRS